VANGAGYPRVTQMHESHDALITKLSQVTQELEQEVSEAAAQHFVEFLRDWLISHVIKEDLQMKPFLLKFSPKFDPRK
jgi:hemerythrin-like metal-binding protein